jgi:hypothetical protein
MYRPKNITTSFLDQKLYLIMPTPVYTGRTTSPPHFEKAKQAQTSSNKKSRLQELHKPSPLGISIVSYF